MTMAQDHELFEHCQPADAAAPGVDASARDLSKHTEAGQKEHQEEVQYGAAVAWVPAVVPGEDEEEAHAAVGCHWCQQGLM